MDIDMARGTCALFAHQHKLIFDEEGECGFGRECVGFRHGDNWVDYNPIHMETFEPVPEADSGDVVYPPEGVNAYHKDQCLVVLGRGDEAIIGLARWVEKMEAAGTVEVVQYRTGANGIQAMITGLFGMAVVVRSPEVKQDVDS